jgi:hypothetical protein
MLNLPLALRILMLIQLLAEKFDVDPASGQEV